MAGLFTGGEQDLLGNIMTQRQQANQALGSGYGKYGGIVQAAAGMADVGADAMTGGMIGSSDPRMQQLQGAKAIFTQIAQEMGEVSSANFYDRLAKELAAKGFPEQSQKAADKAMEIKKSTAPKAPPSVGTAAELIAQTKFNKPFASLSQQEKAVVYEEAKKNTSTGEGLASLAAAITKGYGKKAGEDVAESVAPKVIQGKEDTLGALNRAQELLKDGIYTGGLASAKMAVSKYTPLGSQEKLENTEKYIAFVSTTVIPLLKEFGGNDSNEELKFLQRLVGGEITLEEETLKEIIDSAIIKTKRSIERTQKNVKNVAESKPLATDVTPQSFGGKPSAPIGVGESTTVNGVSIKRIK